VNVTARDYGAYRCVAKNQYGEADGVITFHRKLLFTLFYTHQLALERTADDGQKEKSKNGNNACRTCRREKFISHTSCHDSRYSIGNKRCFSFQRISACYGTRFISNMTTTAAYLEIGIFPKQDGIK
jgi:hypothetical protein